MCIHFTRRMLAILSLLPSLLLGTRSTQADVVMVTVNIENLSPANSSSFAPLRLGFGNGTFDSFNIGQVANNAIVSVAEGGTATDWFPAFQAAEPNAVLGSVGGALLPGAIASNSFIVDTAVNRFFTFGSMVIPSNDLFIGNDSPTQYQLFDPSGNLLINSILQNASQIWDANSELANPLNAAFVVGGNNDSRTPENGVVAFDFSELNAFNGVNTPAGYTFSNLLSGSTDVYRISFSSSAVPEPSSALLAALPILGAVIRRRKRLSA
jgi:hypothetical protein